MKLIYWTGLQSREFQARAQLYCRNYCAIQLVVFTTVCVCLCVCVGYIIRTTAAVDDDDGEDMEDGEDDDLDNDGDHVSDDEELEEKV